MAIATQTNKRTTISTAITSGSATVTLTSAVFVDFTSGYLTFDYDNPALLEVIKCSVSGSTVTITTRGQDGTSAQDHAIGAKVAWNLSKSDLDRVANRTLGYAQVTASQGTFTSETDLTGLAVTVTVPTGGVQIRITGTATFQSSVTGDAVSLVIKEGSTYYQYATVGITTNSSGFKAVAIASFVATAGSHTYKLAALRGVGSGNITMYSDGNQPAFILVENIE